MSTADTRPAEDVRSRRAERKERDKRERDERERQFTDPPTRAEFSQFVQTVWNLLRNVYSYARDGCTGEARAFDLLGEVLYVFRSFEAAPVDGVFLTIPEDMDIADLPPDGTSYYDLWKWARNHVDVGFLSFDVKTISLRSEVKTTEYAYSMFTGKYDQCAVILLVFENADLDDYVALVPSMCWEKATQGSQFGLDVLISKAPAWCHPFMVHKLHLAVAVDRLLRAARHGSNPFSTGRLWYTNPTTGVRFTGWRLRLDAYGRIAPQGNNSLLMRAFEQITGFWADLERAGARVVWSDVAPYLFDYWIDIDGLGLLGAEQKVTKVKARYCKDSLATGRRSPLAKSRFWHVLIIQCADGVLCFTQDEIKHDHRRSTRRAWMTREFISQHLFRSDADSSDVEKVIAHLKKHAAAARARLQETFEMLKPKHFAQRLNMRAAVGVAVETLHLRDPKDDPLSGLLHVQKFLPWITSQINAWCHKMGYGVCLPLAIGHPLGTHVFVEHIWTSAELKAYSDYGQLPFHVFSGWARHKRCVVLRFQDHTSTTCGPPQDTMFSMRRRFWSKPVQGVHFLIIGSVLDRSLCENLSQACSWYLLLPSQVTSMFEHDDFLQQPRQALKSGGQHMYRASNNYTDQALPSAPRGVGSVPFTAKFQSGDEDLERYILSMHDGSIYRQICDVLRSEGTFVVGSNRRLFDSALYNIELQKVSQMAWDYGYTCWKPAAHKRQRFRPVLYRDQTGFKSRHEPVTMEMRRGRR